MPRELPPIDEFRSRTRASERVIDAPWGGTMVIRSVSVALQDKISSSESGSAASEDFMRRVLLRECVVDPRLTDEYIEAICDPGADASVSNAIVLEILDLCGQSSEALALSRKTFRPRPGVTRPEPAGS